MSASGNETNSLGAGKIGAQHARASVLSLVAKLCRKIVTTDVLRSGYLLALSTALTSVLGVIFWSAAARNYSPQEVGIDATLVSLLVTMGNIGQLNMINVLHRFLPQSGIAGTRFVILIYAITVCCACVLGALFASASSYLGFDLPRYYMGVPFSLLFAVSVAVWTLYLLQDAVLVGLRLSAVVPIANAIYAISKIAVLVALPALVLSNQSHNILLAWVLPLLPILVGVNIYIFRQLARRPYVGEPLPLRSLAQFYGWDYVGSLASLCALGIQPVIVLHELGSKSAASYQFAWMISYPMYLVCRSMGMSIVAEAAAHPENRSQLMANALIHTLVPLTLMAGGVIIFAPWLMGFFGSQYIEGGATTLRLFALAMLPWGITTLFIAWARAMSDTKVVAAIQIVTAVLTVIFTYVCLFLVGLPGAGLAVLLTQILVMGAVLYVLSKYNLKLSQMEIATALSAELLHLNEAWKSWVPRRSGASHSASEIADLKLILPQLRNMVVHENRRSLSGTKTLLYSDIGGTPSLVVKIAETEEGIASLKRSRSVVRSLLADARLADRMFSLPEVLYEAEDSSRYITAEAVIPGFDGAHLVEGSPKSLMRYQAAASALRYIADKTRLPLSADKGWVTTNILRPLEAIRPLRLIMIDERSRSKAMERIEASLTRYFTTRDLIANLAHGDFCPANVMFEKQLAPGSEPPVLNAIIDWDMMKNDLPSGFDACHFIMVARCMSKARELGHVVEELISEPCWTEDELRWLTVAVPDGSAIRADRETIASMVIVVWLHHVANNLGKSKQYQNASFWKLNNISRVLQAISSSQSPLFK